MTFLGMSLELWAATGIILVELVVLVLVVETDLKRRFG